MKLTDRYELARRLDSLDHEISEVTDVLLRLQLIQERIDIRQALSVHATLN